MREICLGSKNFLHSGILIMVLRAALRHVVRTNVRRRASTQCLQYAATGDPTKVVELKTVPLKEVGSNDVKVKMLAAPINPADINTIQGVYPVKPPLPAIGGFEGVGEIVETGSAVSTLKKGDWVIPREPGPGTWCTETVGAESSYLKIRNDIHVTAAAMLAVNPCTAYRMLHDFVALNAGDVVLQNGGNSGVGQAVIQIAKELGYVSVNVIRDRPNLDEMKNYLKSLGATYVLTEEQLKGADGKSIWSKHGQPKLALNCVGGKSTLYLASALAERGKLVSYGGMSKRPLEVPVGPLIFKQIELHGYWMTRWNADEANKERRLKMLAYLTELIKRDKFIPPEFESNKLTDYKNAFAKSMEGYAKKQIFMF